MARGAVCLCFIPLSAGTSPVQCKWGCQRIVTIVMSMHICSHERAACAVPMVVVPIWSAPCVIGTPQNHRAGTSLRAGTVQALCTGKLDGHVRRKVPPPRCSCHGAQWLGHGVCCTGQLGTDVLATAQGIMHLPGSSLLPLSGADCFRACSPFLFPAQWRRWEHGWRGALLPVVIQTPAVLFSTVYIH